MPLETVFRAWLNGRVAQPDLKDGRNDPEGPLAFKVAVGVLVTVLIVLAVLFAPEWPIPE
jgi:hypothetical protein